MEKLLRKVGMSLGAKLLVRLVREVAEGKHGEALRNAYWALEGVKRYTGILVCAFAIGASAAGEVEFAAYAFTFGGALYMVGLLDATWRDLRPSVVLQEFALYRFLAGHAATLTLAMATLAAFVQAGYCGGYDCALLTRGLVVVGAVLAYLGLLDAAWRSTPPLVVPPPSVRT